FTTLNYRTDQSGFIANITVYDSRGREIRKLAQNELLAREGFFTWDGTFEQGRKVPVGYYLFYIELFDLNGEVQVYKETVAVGAKF
ncbi:MAG: hypothetical protein LPJ89_05965, partial [Hymenobacteraceae bacterium]|nr:hypothetical protein [Hymenobacteraceae bacterium]MDX5394560.1 hypothetical protein [Hymenobacteraceae bacterium]MDX5443315.1 hypothetical protein [Hymenobacteraceae bacterium]MDX5510581.1 hypothetical protein [Hymenobacteraceae bacterium]